MEQRWIAMKDVARMLGVHEQTVRKWRGENPPYGPPCYRIGGGIRYRKSEVVEWINAKKEEHLG